MCLVSVQSVESLPVPPVDIMQSSVFPTICYPWLSGLQCKVLEISQWLNLQKGTGAACVDKVWELQWIITQLINIGSMYSNTKGIKIKDRKKWSKMLAELRNCPWYLFLWVRWSRTIGHVVFHVFRKSTCISLGRPSVWKDQHMLAGK